MSLLPHHRQKFSQLCNEDDLLMNEEILHEKDRSQRRREVSEEILSVAEAMNREVNKVCKRQLPAKTAGEPSEQEILEIFA